MRLHIIRHGETDWNVERRIQGHLDSELNELGFKQARERGNDLIDIPFSAVYSSSSLRTRQTTTELLGNRLVNGLVDSKFPVIYMDELKEVCLGVWEGKLWSDIAAAYPAMVEAHKKADNAFDVEGAESMYQTQERGIKAIESIISQQRNTSPTNGSNEILIVSHGAIMKDILAYYLDIPLTELHSRPSLPNCAHCIIDIDGSERSVVQIANAQVDQWVKK
jgi:probable phosphoglycerate mutase